MLWGVQSNKVAVPPIDHITIEYGLGHEGPFLGGSEEH
jgi:hypothetical protein